MIKNIQMDLIYMNTIPAPPRDVKELFKQACSNDGITISSWRDQWIAQFKANHAKYGPFKDHSVGSLYGANALKPCIVAGSGPTLENNINLLAAKSKKVCIISCLHNFHYMVDNDVDVDYYVTLDAGEVTIEEISEGGKHDHDYYIEATKDKTLLAFVSSHPKLLESWKGKILFFNAPIPDQVVTDEFNKIERFDIHVGNGGNVLGASTYIAKGILGSNPLAFVGADFCFSYTNKFHPWDSKYDKDLGRAMRAVDVFGNSVRTWGSYYNFKCWFDYIACQVPGIWINCSEGGTWGSYPEGNIQQVTQMPLEVFFNQYFMFELLEKTCKNPDDARDENGQITLIF